MGIKAVVIPWNVYQPGICILFLKLLGIDKGHHFIGVRMDDKYWFFKAFYGFLKGKEFCHFDVIVGKGPFPKEEKFFFWIFRIGS